jgi:hypothetical protein
MTAPCCARRVSSVAASIVPGALLALLPKCPLCLAAWVTLASGVSFSEAGAARLQESIVVFLIAALLAAIKHAVAPFFRRRNNRINRRNLAPLRALVPFIDRPRPGNYYP